jgi:hypothetical protein
MSIKIKKFDMSKVDFNRKCVFIGKTGTGKSILVRDLLFNLKDKLPVGQVISSTEFASPFYSKFIPKIVIHEEYDTLKIKKMVDRQKKTVKRFSETDPRAGCFLILDDCLHDAKWKKDKNILNIFFNGRHYALLFILAVQYPMGISPELRTNIDYTFILRENIQANRKRLYENYAGMFKTFDEFCQTLDKLTENYGCMVINNRTHSNKLEDQVFHYKAEMHEDFKMCSPSLWEFSEKNYKSDNSDEDEEETPKGGKKKIVIKKI